MPTFPTPLQVALAFHDRAQALRLMAEHASGLTARNWQALAEESDEEARAYLYRSERERKAKGVSMEG